MNAVLDTRKTSSNIFLVSDQTSSSQNNLESNLLALAEMTGNVPLTANQDKKDTQNTRQEINELKRLTGLTWEQIAQLFKVSRRTVHFWASGQRLNSSNEERLNSLLNTIKYINRGSASQNRHLLLKDTIDGKQRYFDLLINGQYQIVKDELATKNVTKRIKANSLSKEASELRKPLSPDKLVDALQEPIHRSIGRSRTVKSVRSRKK